MTYSVKYKAPGWIFWRTIKNVKGDGIVEGRTTTVQARYFILFDDTRIELPTSFMFRFDKDRCASIEKAIKREAGH